MFAWITENIGTIIAVIVLIGIITIITIKIVKDKKKGKTSCGCNCEHCAMSGSCHNRKST